MTAKCTNRTNIDMAIALWLAYDSYDHHENTISATALLKPTRELVLADRVEGDAALPDVATMLKSSMGTAIHDSIERVWIDPKIRAKAMEALSIPKGMAEKVVINPTIEQIKADPDLIAVSLEQRHFKEFMGQTISGKSDWVIQGEVADNKTTGVYHYIKDTKTDKFRKQGSIYRWLNPELITADTCKIHWIFYDWKAYETYKEGYPSSDVVTETYNLMSYTDTERMVKTKLEEIKFYKKAPDSEIPECTPDELWMDAPTFKYYKNPAKTDGRSTKNFTSITEAQKRLHEDGNIGVVKTVFGKAKACGYCPAASICQQRMRLAEQDMLG